MEEQLRVPKPMSKNQNESERAAVAEPTAWEPVGEAVDPWAASLVQSREGAIEPAQANANEESSSQWRSSQWTPWWWSSSSWGSRPWSSNEKSGFEKGDYSDPPPFPGFDAHYRIYRMSLERWNSSTDVAVHRRADKVLRTLSWEIQAQLIDAIDPAVLTSETGIEAIIAKLDVKAKWRQEHESRRVFRQALFEVDRRKGESITQFASRREAQLAAAQSLGHAMPAETQGSIVLEGAQLSLQDERNVRTITGGDMSLPVILRALSLIDVETSEHFTKKGPSGLSYHENTRDPHSDHENAKDVSFPSSASQPAASSAPAPPVSSSTESSFGMTEEIEESLLEELGAQDVGEEDAYEAFAVIERSRRRSWKQAQEVKRGLKTDRGFYDEAAKSDRAVHEKGVRFPPEKKMQKVTRCFHCKQKGHWKKNCPQLKRSSSEQTPQQSYFFFDSGDSASWNGMEFSIWKDTAREALRIFLQTTKGRTSSSEESELQEGTASWSVQSFLAVSPGEALVDTAAAQFIAGSKAVQELKERLGELGLRPVPVKVPLRPSSGIGGTVTPSAAYICPIALGSRPGFAKLVELPREFPPLLPIGLLDAAEADILTRKNQVVFHAHGGETVEMRRVGSAGHRAIDIVSGLRGRAGELQVPPELRKEYGLEPHHFRLQKGLEFSRFKLSDERRTTSPHDIGGGEGGIPVTSVNGYPNETLSHIQSSIDPCRQRPIDFVDCIQVSRNCGREPTSLVESSCEFVDCRGAECLTNRPPREFPVLFGTHAPIPQSPTSRNSIASSLHRWSRRSAGPRPTVPVGEERREEGGADCLPEPPGGEEGSAEGAVSPHGSRPLQRDGGGSDVSERRVCAANDAGASVTADTGAVIFRAGATGGGNVGGPVRLVERQLVEDGMESAEADRGRPAEDHEGGSAESYIDGEAGNMLTPDVSTSEGRKSVWSLEQVHDVQRPLAVRDSPPARQGEVQARQTDG